MTCQTCGRTLLSYETRCIPCFNALRWKTYIECSLFTVPRSARLHYNYLNRLDNEKPKQWRRSRSVEVRS